MEWNMEWNILIIVTLKQFSTSDILWDTLTFYKPFNPLEILNNSKSRRRRNCLPTPPPIHTSSNGGGWSIHNTFPPFNTICVSYRSKLQSASLPSSAIRTLRHAPLIPSPPHLYHHYLRKLRPAKLARFHRTIEIELAEITLTFTNLLFFRLNFLLSCLSFESDLIFYWHFTLEAIWETYMSEVLHCRLKIVLL